MIYLSYLSLKKISEKSEILSKYINALVSTKSIGLLI